MVARRPRPATGTDRHRRDRLGNVSDSWNAASGATTPGIPAGQSRRTNAPGVTHRKSAKRCGCRPSQPWPSAVGCSPPWSSSARSSPPGLPGRCCQPTLVGLRRRRFLRPCPSRSWRPWSSSNNLLVGGACRPSGTSRRRRHYHRSLHRLRPNDRDRRGQGRRERRAPSLPRALRRSTHPPLRRTRRRPGRHRKGRPGQHR